MPLAPLMIYEDLKKGYIKDEVREDGVEVRDYS
jgi:hypothetical protein